MGLDPTQLVKNQPARPASPEILVVGGGKGGVGKTCFSVNTAVEIARRGWRVVLMDADLSCSNIESVLGFRSPRRLATFHQTGPKSLQTLSLHIADLWLIPGTSGLMDAANPRFREKVASFGNAQARRRPGLQTRTQGTPEHARFLLMTHTNGVFATPERTSIDNALAPPGGPFGVLSASTRARTSGCC